MLFKSLVAALAIDQVVAFHAPMTRVTNSRSSAISMDNSWRRSYDGKGGAGGAAAASGSMSVGQACAFFAANPSIDASQKKAFLQSKGVSAFVIAQSECTATGMEKTVAGHPGEEKATASMSVEQACAFFAANPGIDASEKKAFLASQGVSDFVIAQAECTATGMEKTVAGHP